MSEPVKMLRNLRVNKLSCLKIGIWRAYRYLKQKIVIKNHTTDSKIISGLLEL